MPGYYTYKGHRVSEEIHNEIEQLSNELASVTLDLSASNCELLATQEEIATLKSERDFLAVECERSVGKFWFVVGMFPLATFLAGYVIAKFLL